MLSFDQAVIIANRSNAPAVEGFANHLDDKLRVKETTEVRIKVESILQEKSFSCALNEELTMDGWSIFTTTTPVLLGDAWDAVRAILSVPGVDEAEPLLLTVNPVHSTSMAQQSFAQWQ